MSFRARPALLATSRGARMLSLWIPGVVGWLALAASGCNGSGAIFGAGAFGTGAFGAGAGQPSCAAVSARLEECGLPPTPGCSSPCEGECLEAASCTELDALFAGGAPPGPLLACLQACAAAGGDGTGAGSTGSSGGGGEGGSGSSGNGAGGGDGGSSGNGSSGNGSSSSSSSGSSSSGSGSGSSSSGGLMHPQCAGYADAICGNCHGANVCGTGDCISCASSLCDEIYDQCGAFLACQASTCGSCCGMACSPC